VVGADVMAPARALAFVLSNHADWDATNITVTGKNAKGETITEDFAVPNGGNATVNGSKLFRTVTEVSDPAQTGTGGTFTLGVRARFTASGASGTKVVVTTTIAGELIAFESWSGATLAVADVTADPGLEADLNAILAADNDWYGLLIDSNSKAQALAAAAWAESNKKLFAVQTGDTPPSTARRRPTICRSLEALAYARTLVTFHPRSRRRGGSPRDHGDRFPDDPGSDTWATRPSPGVAVYELTDTAEERGPREERQHVHEPRRRGATEPGKVAGGEWVDIVRFLDWLRSRLRSSVFSTLRQGKKRPYTERVDHGLTGADPRVLNAGRARGRHRRRPPHLRQARPASRTSAPTRTARARLLPDVEFSAFLAGAIHAVQIRGTLSQ
jgi:hypothetical protein